MMVHPGWLVFCLLTQDAARQELRPPAQTAQVLARQEPRPPTLQEVGQQELRPPMPQASMVEWSGTETFSQALERLNKTGNVVIDGRASRHQPVLEPALKLSAGKKSFWAALDEVCAQGLLQPVFGVDRIELTAAEGKRSTWIAYDGPWRARLQRRTSIAYDDPVLDRLICQVEVTVEPRLAPLLLTLGAAMQQGSYHFDGELVKLIDVRLPLPPRSTARLEQLVVEGQAWVAPSRLNLALEAKKNAQTHQENTTFTIKDIQVNQISRVWEVATELAYPEGSLEWESHQSRLLSSAKLTLKKGEETYADAGREIRTDAGRRVTMIWFFRNVPGAIEQYQARLMAPAAPVKMPVKLVFRNIDLP